MRQPLLERVHRQTRQIVECQPTRVRLKLRSRDVFVEPVELGRAADDEDLCDLGLQGQRQVESAAKVDAGAHAGAIGSPDATWVEERHDGRAREEEVAIVAGEFERVSRRGYHDIYRGPAVLVAQEVSKRELVFAFREAARVEVLGVVVDSAAERCRQHALDLDIDGHERRHLPSPRVDGEHTFLRLLRRDGTGWRSRDYRQEGEDRHQRGPSRSTEPPDVRQAQSRQAGCWPSVLHVELPQDVLPGGGARHGE